jgi:hypothetical protein
VIAGHFGFAAMVKSRERTTPLWALMLATVWLDIVFVPLLVLHIESMQPLSQHPGYGGNIIHADYTHSLVGMIVLSAALAAAFLPRWGKRVALVIGLVAASHWVLDLLVHRADMPILPANMHNLPLLGFGLWRYPSLAACLELLLVAAGSILYWRAAREVAVRAGQGSKWASISAALIAVSGLLVLFLDVAS